MICKDTKNETAKTFKRCNLQGILSAYRNPNKSRQHFMIISANIKNCLNVLVPGKTVSCFDSHLFTIKKNATKTKNRLGKNEARPTSSASALRHQQSGVQTISRHQPTYRKITAWWKRKRRKFNSCKSASKARSHPGVYRTNNSSLIAIDDRYVVIVVMVREVRGGGIAMQRLALRTRALWRAFRNNRRASVLQKYLPLKRTSHEVDIVFQILLLWAHTF